VDSVTDDFLIAGGGIAGLAITLGLAQAGYRVRLVEQAGEIAPIGYGIQLGPNTLGVLRELGVADAVLEASHKPSALVMLDITDGPVANVSLRGEFERCFSGQYICIHRADLHEILLSAIATFENVTLEHSTLIQSFEEADGLVTAFAADGRPFVAKALIATDGVKSGLRTAIHDDPPCSIGYVAHRTIAPMSVVPAIVRRDEVTLWVTEKYHVIYYPLRGGSELNIVAVFHEEMTSPELEGDPYAAALRARIGATSPELDAVLDLMDYSRFWPIVDRDPVRHWSKGRFTLAGDAAHATLQSLAQGAGMAIEDAYTLVRQVKQHDDDLPSAFRNWEKERILRTARVQLESRSLWRMYHCGGIERDVRNQTYGAMTSDDFLRCLEWLWKGIVPLDEVDKRSPSPAEMVER
jgi:salicylate hydroxylase